MSGGKIEGSVRDKGMFGGGARSFLLSDRWFSYDHELRADINVVSMTALAESVKKMLATQGDLIPVAKTPVAAKRIGFFERVTPTEPTRPPSAPTLPEPPTPPTDMPWQAHFRESAASSLKAFLVLALLFGAVGTVAFGSAGLIVAAIVFLGFPFTLPFSLVASFSANKKAREWYVQELEKHPKRLAEASEAHARSILNFEVEWQAFESDVEKAKAQTDMEAQEIARFESEMDGYKEAIARTSLHREMLWEHTRVCSRCSNTYLPGGVLHSSPSRIQSIVEGPAQLASSEPEPLRGLSPPVASAKIT